MRHRRLFICAFGALGLIGASSVLAAIYGGGGGIISPDYYVYSKAGHNATSDCDNYDYKGAHVGLYYVGNNPSEPWPPYDDNDAQMFDQEFDATYLICTFLPRVLYTPWADGDYPVGIFGEGWYCYEASYGYVPDGGSIEEDYVTNVHHGDCVWKTP